MIKIKIFKCYIIVLFLLMTILLLIVNNRGNTLKDSSTAMEDKHIVEQFIERKPAVKRIVRIVEDAIQIIFEICRKQQKEEYEFGFIHIEKLNIFVGGKKKKDKKKKGKKKKGKKKNKKKNKKHK